MKRTTKRGFIYFRYIFPIIAALLMMILAFIPVYRYISADTGINQAISLWELMGNSWDTVRAYLFDGGAEKLEPTMDFSRTVLILIISLVLLFVIGLASAVWTAITAIRYFSDGDTDEKSRVLFLTLVPNRIFSCLYSALMLPIFALPMIMPLLYDGILAYHVELTATPFDMFFVALALWVATIVITAISAQYEIAELNVFSKRHVADDEQNTQDADEPAEDEDAYSAMDRRAREEQAERIRKLLYKDNDTQEEDNK